MLSRLFRQHKPASSGGGEEREAARKEADRLIDEGQRLEDRGDLEPALRIFQSAAAIAPGYARAYMNVAHVLEQLRRWDDAQVAHRNAVQHSPDYAPARFNLGQFLSRHGGLKEAEEELLAASRLRPDLAEARIALADLYERLERPDEAERQYESAIQIPPTHPGALFNFGMFCLAQGRLKEASDLFAKAKSFAPGMRDAESAVLFALNFRTDLDPETIADRHRAVGEMITSGAIRPFTSWSNGSDPERKLRIGYVSGDFFLHPVAHFLEPVLEHHSSRNVETFCYSSYYTPDPVADSLRQKSHHWRDVHEMDDRRFIECIRQDEIDVLVDLSGHTNRNRLHVFASHPAPVQITWLGYLNTTGLAAMDYRVCDWHTDPDGAEPLYTEKLLRMPDSQWCYTPWCPAESVAHPHPDQPEAVVFGSFNQVAKISDASIQIWARILRELPDARLFVMDVRQAATGRQLCERFAKHGVEASRLTFRGRESLEGYYASVGQADIALDTFPYNGATTTLDALWMGVPVVALRGERSISRSSYSILKTLEAEELIALSVDEYVAINVRLATDVAWRSQLRMTLRRRLETSPLMDAAKFTQALEQHYRAVWRTWCASQKRTASQ